MSEIKFQSSSWTTRLQAAHPETSKKTVSGINFSSMRGPIVTSDTVMLEDEEIFVGGKDMEEPVKRWIVTDRDDTLYGVSMIGKNFPPMPKKRTRELPNLSEEDRASIVELYDEIWDKLEDRRHEPQFIVLPRIETVDMFPKSAFATLPPYLANRSLFTKAVVAEINVLFPDKSQEAKSDIAKQLLGLKLERTTFRCKHEFCLLIYK